MGTLARAASFALIISITCAWSTASPAQAVKQIIDRVFSAGSGAENTENIQTLNVIIEAKPSHDEEMLLRALRAKSRLNLRRAGEAIEDLDYVLSKKPLDPHMQGLALDLRGRALRQLEEYDAARRDFLALLATPGWSADGNYNLALLAMEQRDFSGVIAWAASVPKDYQFYPGVVAVRGVAHRALGNLASALADQDAALALGWTAEFIPRERAYVLAEMGKHDQGLAILRSLHEKSVLRLKDAHLIDMIPIYMAAGRYDDARRAADAIAVRYESQGWRMVVALAQGEGRGIPKVDARGADIPLSWPFVIGSLYGGHASPEQVLQSIEDDPFARRTGAEARAYYAIAHYHLAWGNRDAARQAFRSVLVTGSYDMAEFLGARLGLQKLAR